MRARGLRPRTHRRLRVRVAAAFALGALALAAALAIVTYVLSERYLLDQRERFATRQTYLDARVVRDSMRADPRDPAAVLSGLDISEGRQAFLNRAAEWYATGLGAGEEAIPQRLRALVASGTAGRQRFTFRGQSSLAVGVPVAGAGADFYQVFSLDELERTLSVIRGSLLAAAATTTVAAAILGGWMARRALRPVNDVSTAAARIATGDLSARLDAQSDPDLERVVTSFNSMADALEERIERDARFVSDVSHELRSPLTTLAASAGVVERGAEAYPPRVRDAVELMVGEISRFQRVVEELLELSRAEADVDPLDLGPVAVGDLVVNVTTRFRGDPLVVEVDPDVARAPLALDKRRIERILVNLLENARTHGGGAVKIAARRDGARLRIEVDDAGPGVPVDERERIFERFHRGSGAGRRMEDESTGLGLALVAEHVRVHDGEARVEDRAEGPGARFVVLLPWIPT